MKKSKSAPWNSEQSIREEVFGRERFEQHAVSLAKAQSIYEHRKPPRSLATRLAENEAILLNAHKAIAGVVAAGHTVTPAAEWLVNNSHVIESQIRAIRKNLPPAFAKQLPMLKDDSFDGFPRVFGIAWAFVAHTDSRFDTELFKAFVKAYQSVTPLTIGELWALPQMIQLVLVENLRRAARRVLASREQRKDAEILADRLLLSPQTAAADLHSTAVVDEQGELKQSFLSELVFRLSEVVDAPAAAHDWLHAQLSARDLTTEEVVRGDHRTIGATNSTVRHIIRSLRVMPDADWAKVFEDLSLVDSVLGQSTSYLKMDFATRNAYRDAIEELARRSPLSEIEIAAKATRNAAQAHPASKQSEPGYYLIGRGQSKFRKSVNYQHQLSDVPALIASRGGLIGYATGILILTIVMLQVPVFALVGQSVSTAMLWAVALVGFLPALDLAVAIVNQAITHEVQPKIIAGMELRDGVPGTARTLVVVPTMISDIAAIDEMAARLETHHLATHDANVFYALLTDWLDAPEESMPGDRRLLDHARSAITRLNRLYPAAEGSNERFYLFHRPRRWNATQASWMGWERKRGKLHELNQLLLGVPTTAFSIDDIVNPAVPDQIKYVITLDSDTRLPRDAARRMIGKMLHPLNAPVISSAHQRVLDGYGILQPRVTPSFPTEQDASLFQKLFSSAGGIDPYAGAVSDVYQDLFGEGSFAGKGIYDVEAFETVLAGRIPENAVLSHDLLEGLYSRSGLATDIEVVEEFPSHYDVSRSRDHRWARGDWQLLPWIVTGTSRLRGPSVDRTPDTLSALGRWKLTDNIRRTLSPISMFLGIVLGWFLPIEAAAIWIAFLVVSIILPTFLGIVAAMMKDSPDTTLRSHLAALASDARLALLQSSFQIVVLADRAYTMADAIVRSLYRLFVTHKYLLEWTTAAQSKSMAAATVSDYYGRMSGGIIAAALAGLLAFAAGSGGAVFALPFVVVWFAAPKIARWVSFAPAGEIREEMTAEDRAILRLTGWQTWLYFERFVTQDDNYLPPDNFQEDPRPVVARRTSPTNIGLYLLSTVAAHRFGWISTSNAADRLEKTLRTMGRLEQHNGHYYNWYNTETLEVLHPRYVSTVDSGNLAGHLIAVANACRAWAENGPHSSSSCDGIRDCIAALKSTTGSSDGAVGDYMAELEALLDHFDKTANGEELSAKEWDDVEKLTISLRERIESDASNPVVVTTVQALYRTAHLHSVDANRDSADIRALKRRLTAIADAAQYIAMSMDFGFLINQERELLAIGFAVDDGALDESCYDLLASEARLASFVAIAKGDLPTRHWFRLGRTLLPISATSVLSSWSGSMFEYMMPELVTLTPQASLLGISIRNAVLEQIRFGKRKGTPWGVSESALNERDLEFTYQYSPFGLPQLGLKRGLNEDHVIAPYATGLASMIVPSEAAKNYEALAEMGGRGIYGFYEAIDFTPTRVPAPQKYEVIKAYMSHHQGMTIVALANAIFDNFIAKYFHQSAFVQAAELLLQERAPRLVPKFAERATLVKVGNEEDEPKLSATRRITSVNAAPSECHIIGNGRLSVLISPTGSGATMWDGVAVTRAGTDQTLDDVGSFIYLRDTTSGVLWSAGYQPVCAMPSAYDAAFSEDRIQINRVDGSLQSSLEVIVSPEDDATGRRMSLTNTGKKKRTIELTSYEELVLGSADGYASHPAFHKLFVQTEFDAELGAVLAHRRPRGHQDKPVWAATFVTGDGDDDEIEFETDRGRFIGSGRTLAGPIAVIGGQRLKNSAGSVLDPIFSLRRRVTIAPGATVRVCFWTIVAPSRERLQSLVQKYADRAAFVRAATLAWTVGRVELRHLGINAEEALMFQRLTANVLSCSRALRAPEAVLQRGAVGLNALWSAGISGDLPIVLLQIDELADIGIVRQCLHAFEYWRRKGLEIDLVVLNDHEASYQQDLQQALNTLFHAVSSRHRLSRDNTKGSVFLLRNDLLHPECRSALQSFARAVLNARGGTLAEQLSRTGTSVPAMPPPRRFAPTEIATGSTAHQEFEFFNGFGGFRNDGREYTIFLEAGRTTPAPWLNVISNPAFGFQVAADGAGFTWSVNSRERQLTPWSNDPVTNRPGEVFYVRDEETGDLWCPTASPIRDHAAPYTISHGQGYTRFEHASRGIELVLEQFVAPDDPVKISRLTLRNVSGKPRKLSVTSYVEWVLGTTRKQSTANTTTAFDHRRRTIFARNPWHNFFPDRVAFSTILGTISAWTADRCEFLGQSGRVDNPAALAMGRAMRGLAGTGFDPCAALKVDISLPVSSETEIVALLGDAATQDHAVTLIDTYTQKKASHVLTEATRAWDDVLGKLQVSTPDRALDLLVNRWLPYQSLSSRLWARAGLYQAGGAYGYRDQLQDVMAFCATAPGIARAHILVAAGRQFPEGDVQHWWLHPSGHGIRTRIADSCLWLPYVTAHYVKTAGDVDILHEAVPFIDGPQLQPHEQEVYFLPEQSSLSASLYEHCARALDRSLQTGAHGLSLFGGGDWNDGMNRVGIGGAGESVWLSWFIIKCLYDFIPLAEARGDTQRVEGWRSHIAALTESLNRDGWDGQWYRRGYFDDGTPLGSAANEECRIDSIAQSWSVISKAGDPVRARQAMASVEAYLVDDQARLALLFTPPFDQTENDPGYVKAYPPGVRENGGQYTHAALWAAIAFAELGDGDAAGRILSLINPILIAASQAQSRLYRIEPYVIAADVYSVGANKGRGGWSWYTGSAGWYYQAAVQHLLGVRREGDKLIIAPTIPRHWPKFDVTYATENARFHIVVDNSNGVSRGILRAWSGNAALPIREATSVSVPISGVRGNIRVEILMGIDQAAAATQ